MRLRVVGLGLAIKRNLGIEFGRAQLGNYARH